MKTIKEIRTQEKLTQKQMAIRLGVSKSYYEKLEIGKKRFTAEILNRIKTLFEINEPLSEELSMIRILDKNYSSLIIETDSKNPTLIAIIDDSDLSEPVKVADGYRVRLSPRIHD